MGKTVTERYIKGEFENYSSAVQAFEEEIYQFFLKGEECALSEYLGLKPEELAQFLFARKLPPKR